MNAEEIYYLMQGLFLSMGSVLQTSDFYITFEMTVFCICFVFSGLLSGSETALTSMSKLRVKRMFNEDDDSFQKLEPWLHDPNRFLVTILIGNNFFNTLAAVLCENIIEGYLLHLGFEQAVAISAGLSVAATVFLLLVFGEIIPKTLSKEHAVWISLRVIGPLDVVSKMIRPVSFIFIFLSNAVIRMFGGHAIKEVPLMTESDVKTLIEVSEREGVLEPHETEMIANIIDFDIRSVKEIMTPRVDFKAVPLEMPMTEVMDEVIQYGHSRLPVFNSDLDHIEGILYVKDLLKVDIRDESVKLESLIRPALYIPSTKKMDEVLKMFRMKRTHIAIVVDEYGTTDGLVTIEDLLEEIVGDIQDEYDIEEPDYIQKDDQTVIADAKIDLDDLMKVIDVQFDSTDVETLGGFITELIGRVPRSGEQVEFENVRFTILESDERRISKVKIVSVLIPSKDIVNHLEETKENGSS